VKNEILSNLEAILSDLVYYKNKKDIIRFLTKLDNFVNNEEELFKKIIFKMIEDIEKKEFKEENMKEMSKLIFGFIARNEKSYISKNTIDGNVIYEYKNKYSLYFRNKKTNIHEIIEEKFDKKKITSIIIDGDR
jgi:hypothetical protein